MSGSSEDSVSTMLAGIGISRPWAQWLTKTFELESVSDLAELSPNDIEARVREETTPPTRRPSRKVIEAWVDKARKASEEDEAQAAGGGTDEAAAEGAAGGARPLVIADLRGSIADGDGVEPMSLIRIDKQWFVTLEWTVEGEPLPEGNEWLLQVVLRPVAPGRRVLLTSEQGRGIVRAGEDGAHRYHLEIPVGAVTSCETPYHAMALLMYRPALAERAWVAGSLDLSVLQFYEPAAPVGEAAAQPGPLATAIPSRRR